MRTWWALDADECLQASGWRSKRGFLRAGKNISLIYACPNKCAHRHGEFNKLPAYAYMYPYVYSLSMRSCRWTYYQVI